MVIIINSNKKQAHLLALLFLYIGAPRGTLTPNPWFRRPMLYTIKLVVHIISCNALQEKLLFVLFVHI